jgi:hypothetical protein
MELPRTVVSGCKSTPSPSLVPGVLGVLGKYIEEYRVKKEVK